MLTEYIQLNKGATEGKPVIEPVDSKTITAEQNEQALNAVNLIKKKKETLLVKGETCADESKQHQYLKEGELVASPTVFIEAILSTLIINVQK